MSTKKIQILGKIIKQFDWLQTDETAVDYIKNKPDIDGIVSDLNARIDETKESITPESIGAATSKHSHDEYYTKNETDEKIDSLELITVDDIDNICESTV